MRVEYACLDDGEAEGLLEGDVGEDAAGGVGEQVDVGDVLLLVLLGVGHAAVQVVRVDQLHHLRQDLLAARRHAVNVLAVALRMHQITPQMRILQMSSRWPWEFLKVSLVP